MSANDQILIKKYKGKFYVFNVMDESWSEKNELSADSALAVYDTHEEAVNGARLIESKSINKALYSSEYGIIDEVLAKDGAPVSIEPYPVEEL